MVQFYSTLTKNSNHSDFLFFLNPPEINTRTVIIKVPTVQYTSLKKLQFEHFGEFLSWHLSNCFEIFFSTNVLVICFCLD